MRRFWVLSSPPFFLIIRPGEHGSSFGGNPLACEIGTAAMDVLKQEGMVENSAKMGKKMLSHFKELNHPFIKDVRGRGLMNAIEYLKSGFNLLGSSQNGNIVLKKLYLTLWKKESLLNRPTPTQLGSLHV